MNDGFEIPISFPLDKSGAVHANDLLATMRQQIKAATDETAKYNAWLEKNTAAQVEATKAYQETSAGAADLSKTTIELGKNVVSSTKQVEGLTATKREWLKISKLLPPELSAIGSGIKLMFSSPIVAGAMGLLYALGKIRDVISEARQKLDGLKLNDLRADVEGSAEAAVAAATNWDSWDEAIRKTATSADDAIGKLRALNSAQQEVSDAQFDLARAKVEADPNLTPEQKAVKLAGIDSNQRWSNQGRAKALRQAEIKAKQDELDAAQLTSENGLANRKPLSTAAESAAFALNANQDRIANAKAGIAALEDKDKRVGLNSNEYATLRSYKKLLVAAEVAHPDLEARVKTTGAALTNYDQSVGNARSSIPVLQKELEGLKSSDALRTETEQQTITARDEAQRTRISGRMAERGPESALIASAAAGADARLGGGRATADQSAAINLLTQLLGLQAKSQATIVGLFSRMNDNEKNFQTALDQIKRTSNTRYQKP